MTGEMVNANALCLECGLCCNGAIFADVQLQPGDDAARLESLGLRPGRKQQNKFQQPCAAFVNGRCGIYSERPAYCRQFECLLLKQVKAGNTDFVVAQRIIREALRQVKRVKRLLCELDDRDEDLALGRRFRRVKQRMEAGASEQERADRFGELTLAVHELNVRLSEHFYPVS